MVDLRRRFSNSARRGGAVGVTAAVAFGAWAVRQPAAVRAETSTAASIYTTYCAPCHGTDPSGGRAHSLSDNAWLNTMTDERLRSAVKNGVPGKEMPAFGQFLDDRAIRELVQYIRARAVATTAAPRVAADPDGRSLKTAKQAIRFEVIARGLETPWALAFLPDGRLLVTERPGRLRIIDKGVLSAPVSGIPAVRSLQDGGLLDVEVHPRYAENGWIYLAYAEALPGFEPKMSGSLASAAAGRDVAAVPAMTVIVRGRLSNANAWIDQETIFRAPASLYRPSGVHFGCRLIFDRQDHLFFTIGDRGTMEDAQNLSKPTGKIHRVTDTGDVPSDNPFVGRAGALGTIWSYGHRNPEGLAWDPVTGKLWESEHGPGGGDEINIIEPGHNYGWGICTKGVQDGISKTSAPGMDDPVVFYTPSIAPAGISFYTGTRFPGWIDTSLFVTGLAGETLRRLEIDGTSVARQETIFGGFGRVRDIVQGPDGDMYLVLQSPTGEGTGLAISASTPGSVIRIVPDK